MGRAVWISSVVAAVAFGRSAVAQEEDAPAGGGDWSVNGQVLSVAGTAVLGAEVVVELGGTRAAPGDVVGKGTTDEMGDFFVKLRGKPGGDLFVRVTKAGFSSFYGPVEFVEDDHDAFVDVELGGALAIRGHVRNAATSQPVRGCSVVLDMFGRRWDAESNKDGAFELSDVPGGLGVLVLARDGFARTRYNVRVDADTPPVDALLHPEQPVRLLVVGESGEPLAGAEIQVRTAEDTVDATTDEHGRTVLHGIPAGAAELLVCANHQDTVRMADFERRIVLRDAESQPASSQPATPASQPAEHRIVLPRGGKIVGTVVNAAGEPVESARVIIGHFFYHGMPMQWTDAEGRFELSRLPSGPTAITVQHPDYAPEIVEDHLQGGWTRKLQITLSPGKPIAGQVVDEAGKGLEQTQVILTKWRDRDTAGLGELTDADGRFRIEHAPDGPLEFSIFHVGKMPLLQQTLEAGRTDYAFTLKDRPAPPAGAPAGPSPGAVPTPVLRVGDPVPDLTLLDFDSNPYNTTKLKGKYVLIDVWATWCPPCRAEIPTFKRLYADLKSRKDFVLLAISVDEDVDAVKALAREKKIDWPIIAGSDSGAAEAAKAFGVTAIPFNVLIGPDGKIIALQIHGEDMPDRVKELTPAEKDKPPAK